MNTNPHPLINSADLEAELAAIAAEAIGWHPLANGAYLHVVATDETQPIITIVGNPLDADPLANYLLVL